MFCDAVIQKMKRTNISVDPEKTKRRTEELWRQATKEEKTTVTELAGVERTTVARIYKTGSISAKLAVALSQTLNTDPLYLTGDSDDRGEGTRETLRSFMEKHHYTELVSEQDKLDKKADRKSRSTPEPKTKTHPPAGEGPEGEAKEIVEQAAGEDTTRIEAEPTEPVRQCFLDILTEEDMILLMRSILLRAKAGGKNAELAQNLKLLLLS